MHQLFTHQLFLDGAQKGILFPICIPAALGSLGNIFAVEYCCHAPGGTRRINSMGKSARTLEWRISCGREWGSTAHLIYFLRRILSLQQWWSVIFADFITPHAMHLAEELGNRQHLEEEARAQREDLTQIGLDPRHMSRSETSRL